MGMNKITLAQMKDGQEGTVAEIMGGRWAYSRLTSMGLRPGSRIVKSSSMYWHGPVTFRINNTQMAVGRGLANRILVIPDENTSCR